MCPIKMSPYRFERLWSEWVESVRKDVECLFGILKGRFRLLRGGICFQHKDEIDNAVFTAAILHNMILTYDGLDYWEEVDWNLLNPQPTNDDEGFDEDGVVPVANAPAVADGWRPANDNEVIAEVDNNFHAKRQGLMRHLNHCHDTHTLRWPKRFIDIYRPVGY